MPRYRFVAADSDGNVSDGAIDAATQTDARSKLAANGLAVRELEEVAAGAAVAAPPDLPRRAAPKSTSSSGVEPLPTTRRATRAELADPKRRSSRVPLILSSAALAISLFAAAYVVYRDPPWGRLSRYDFSTPESAYTSRIRMETNGDVLAMSELHRKMDSKLIREKLDSLRINKSRQFRGKQILFVEYEQKGMKFYEIEFLERDPDAGNMWRQSYIYPTEIRNVDPNLADEVENWRVMGAGNRKPRGFGEPPP